MTGMESMKQKGKRRDMLFSALISGVIVAAISMLTVSNWVDHSTTESFVSSLALVLFFNAFFFVFAFVALSYRFKLWREMSDKHRKS